jgi:hypothetical protein
MDSQTGGNLGQDRPVPSAAGGNLSRMHKIEKTAKESRMKYYMYSHLHDVTVDFIYTLPPGRWGELVCGAEEGSVSAEEARAVFHCIRQRLDGVTGSAAEGGNSVPVLSSVREQDS